MNTIEEKLWSYIDGTCSDAERKAAEFDIGALAAHADIGAGRDRGQYGLFQRGGRIKPAAHIKSDHQKNGAAQQPEFPAAAVLAAAGLA